ncbi:hypothetical protein L6452_11486 [Arctium lappa]|uniref:Uncharacterized protein n=1 Tax=Arctium lappa TaxID=4217 RepID=A0ACB9DP49_ARCLA|nr:hypothetical protein L6452_11486 [Arctium lappa]
MDRLLPLVSLHRSATRPLPLVSLHFSYCYDEGKKRGIASLRWGRKSGVAMVLPEKWPKIRKKQLPNEKDDGCLAVVTNIANDHEQNVQRMCKSPPRSVLHRLV